MPHTEGRPNAVTQATAPDDAWYAVWLRSHCEHLVADQLDARGFHTFLPELRSRATRTGLAGGARAPMFAGYLFVRDALTKERYVEMLRVRGIVRVLDAGWSRLTTIPAAEIEALQLVVQSGAPAALHPHLRRDDRVRVIEGPLAGLEGLFVGDSQARGRLVVSVNMLGRSIAVELDGAGVEACARATTWVTTRCA